MNKPFKEVIKDAEQALLNLRVDSVNIGKQIERQRIIKLLEEQKAIQCRKAHCESIKDGHDYDCLSEEIDDYIALINGEK